MRKPIICDFCSSKDPPWVFQAGDFVMGKFGGKRETYELTSSGAWAACTVCKEMILSGEWDKLTERSCEMFFEQHPQFIGFISIGEMRKSLGVIHARFRAEWDKREPFSVGSIFRRK